MKFRCGESSWARTIRRGEWHRWFAWRPVRVKEHNCRWLEMVWRRGIFGYDGVVWRYLAISHEDRFLDSNHPEYRNGPV